MTADATAAGKLTIRILRSTTDFDVVAEAWDDLYRRANCNIASLTGGAVRAYLTHRLLAGQSAVVLVAFKADVLIGALPLVSQRRRGRLWFVTFGDHQNYGADFLCDPQAGDTLRRQMLAELLQQYPNAFAVQLLDVREDSDTRRLVGMTREAVGIEELNRFGSYYEVPDGAANIVADLSGNFRKNLRKQEGRLRSLGNIAYEQISAAGAGQKHFERFVSLERSGWKGERGTAIASDPSLLAYYRDIANGLAKSGTLEWHFLSSNEITLAGHLASRSADTVTLLKIAYDESHATCAPGNMLFLRLVRGEVERGSHRSIDCLTDMSWHRNWRMARRGYYTITFYPRRWRSLMIGYLPNAARRWLRGSSLARTIVRPLLQRWRRVA